MNHLLLEKNAQIALIYPFLQAERLSTVALIHPLVSEVMDAF
jgi:hypothetical protein